jgi:predicted nucleic acid-binding Zn ribbon protein
MTETEMSAPASGTPVTDTTTAPTKGVSNLPEHRHCEVCGRSVAMGNRVCSPECQKKFDDAVKQRKRSVWIFVGLIALLLLFNLYGRNLFGAAG